MVKSLYVFLLLFMLFSSNNVRTVNVTTDNNVSHNEDAEADAIWERFSEEGKHTKTPPRRAISQSFTKNVLKSDTVTKSGIGAAQSFLDFMLTENNETIHTNTSVMRVFNGTYGVNGTLRRMNYKDKKAVEAMKNHADKKKERPDREEGIGDPYWPKGDWVFLRTASPTTTSKKNYRGTTFNPMAVHRECDRTCIHYYIKYGKVCGHRYDTRGWKNHYANFSNICDLEHANCVERDKRPSWHLLHKGDCGELQPFVTHPRGEAKEIVDRKIKWDPYTYKPINQTKRKEP